MRIGDIDAPDRLSGGVLGFDITARLRGASCLSSGGYRHHVAVDIWRSAGTGRRDNQRTGRSWLEFQATDGCRGAMTPGLQATRPDGDPLSDPCAEHSCRT